MSQPPVKPKTDLPVPATSDAELRQRNRMLIAVVLLLISVGVVLVKDWNSLFVTGGEGDLQTAPEAASGPGATPATPSTPTLAQERSSKAALPAVRMKKQSRAHDLVAQDTFHDVIAKDTVVKGPAIAATHKALPPVEGPSITATRKALPPLKVEVVAGDQHSLARPGIPSVRVDLSSRSSLAADSTAPAPVAEAGPLTNASENVRISTDTTRAVVHPVRPEYPLLARQMKVQGSVVLEALIGRDGGIQDLQVLQGPAILADAALEAVRQWRFKPYMEDGQAIETQAHITVNFMISTN